MPSMMRRLTTLIVAEPGVCEEPKRAENLRMRWAMAALPTKVCWQSLCWVLVEKGMLSELLHRCWWSSLVC